MRKTLLIIFLAVVFCATSFAGAVLSPSLQMKVEQIRSRSGDLKLTSGEEEKFSVIIKASDFFSLEASGVEVNRITDEYATARLTVSEIDQLSENDAVMVIEETIRKKPHNDIAIPYINADDVNTMGYTGDDILIGIIDSGIDLDHPAFLDGSGNTRILYLWDQTVGNNTITAGGFSKTLGTEWTGAQIDAGSCTQTDTNGHGTHVSGSAAGYDTSYTGRKGSANTANIIFVKTNFSDTVDAVDYINERAKIIGKPVIINMSLGSQWGPHDGTDSETAAVDTMIANSAGDLLVVRSAGNDADNNIHASLDNISTTAKTVDFNVGAYTADSNGSNDFANLNFWYDSAVNLQVRVTDSAGNNSGWITDTQPNGYYDHTTPLGDSTGLYVYLFDHDADTKGMWIQIGDMTGTANNYIRPGSSWKVEFKTASGTVNRLDGWIYQTQSDSSAYDNAVTFNEADPSYMTLGNDACGNNVIVVGAFMSRHDWNAMDGGNYSYDNSLSEGEITGFSSNGPTRDGRNKPDITGPGSAILSTKSSDAYTAIQELPNDGSDGTYRYMQGTSMSSPVVAGGVALLKEVNTDWTYSDVIDYFKTNSQGTSEYAWVSNSWDRAWGWGVLDLTNVSPLNAFSMTAPVDGAIINTSESVVLAWESAGSGVTYNVEMDTSDSFSSPMAFSTSNTTLTLPAPTPGTYYYRVEADNGSVQRYSENVVSVTFTALDVPGDFQTTKADDGSTEETLYLLSQAVDASNTLEFSWEDTNNTSAVTYAGAVYSYGGAPAAGIVKAVSVNGGIYTMALTSAEANITQPGRYVFRLTITSNSDSSDSVIKEQDLYIRDLEAELLPNLLNDDYVKVGVVGVAMKDDEKTSDAFVLMKYTTGGGSSSYFGMEANGTGAYSSTYTFNNTSYGTPLSVNIALADSPLNVDSGITLTVSSASPVSEPNALDGAIRLTGEDEFTYIRVRHPGMHGIGESEGPIFYIGHVDEGNSYDSETHRLARWKNGKWSDTDRISLSGSYTVLPGKIPVMNFKNGELANSPNPFNPTTTVNYTVGDAGHVRLKIYDSRGRLIRILVDEKVSQAGDYSAFWDGKDSRGREVASGVYYAVLEINGRRFTRKMVMLK